MSAADEMKVFDPVLKTISVAGREVRILNLPVRRYAQFIAACNAFLPKILSGQIMAAVSEDFDAMLKALAIGTDATVEWMEGLDVGDFVVLVEEVAAENADFFAHRVTPGMTRIATTMAERLAGPASSQG